MFLPSGRECRATTMTTSVSGRYVALLAVKDGSMARYGLPGSVQLAARLSRRQAMLGAGAMAAATLLPATTLARQAPDASPAAHDHGGIAIPEVALVGTADGLEFPATVSAGLNRMTIVNDRDVELHIFTVRIPDELSDEAFLEEMSSGDLLPSWWPETHLAGNPDQAPQGGGSLAGYVQYHPGRYVVTDPFTGAMAPFEATGNAWGRPAPVADVEIGLLDIAFHGFDAPLPAGPHLWRITNPGTIWHDMTTFGAPAGATVDDFWAAVETKPEGALFPDGYPVIGGVGAISPGVTTWVELDLAPGTHVAACFLPMIEPGESAGMPHAVLGMITTFEVA
jgi:hypothetical protein